MDTIIQTEQANTRDILKNMYVNVFGKLYTSENYFRHKKITKRRTNGLFDNLKLDEINILSLEQEVSELIELEDHVNKDLNSFKSYSKENFSFIKTDHFFYYFVIPSLLISFLFIFINLWLYIVSYLTIIAFIFLFNRRMHNRIKTAYMIEQLCFQIKQREVEINKEKLKNALLSCVFSNNDLQIVDQDLKKIKYSNTMKIEVQQNQFLIELVGLIRSDRVKMLNKQTKITKAIAEKFNLVNQTKINSESLYKEFNKYYKMNDKEFNNVYQNILSYSIE